MRAFAAKIGQDIPEGLRVNGENVFARHSIAYTALPSYFLVFGMVEGATVLSWDTTVAYAEMLGLATVPVLYRGLWDEQAVRACFTGKSKFGGEQEGFVVRLAEAFPEDQFGVSVAKMVRSGHVTTSNHWAHETVVPNGLQEKDSV